VVIHELLQRGDELGSAGDAQGGEQLVLGPLYPALQGGQPSSAGSRDRDRVASAITGIRCSQDESFLSQVRDESRHMAVARRAVDLGVTLIDTAHMYGWGANEEVLAEALYPYPDDLLIAT